MNQEQLAVLAAELTANNHPTTGAYSADAATAATEINAVNVTRVRASMTGEEVREAMDVTEYNGLTDGEKSQFLALTSNATLNPEVGGVNQSIIVDIFGGASTTVSNLATIRQETVSQATVLGLGVVNALHVQEARGEI